MIDTIRHDAILELRLARPPANALDPSLIRALATEVFAAAERGADALVISGRPGMFSAGLDVPHLLTLDREEIGAAWSGFFEMVKAIALSPIPVAAAITGHSPAGGAVIALHCDWRVMAEGDFRIGLNEVQVGIPLPDFIFSALERTVGTRQAERLGVGGLLLDPGEARAIGLVDELAPPEEVVERAVAWCRSLLALPRGPMLATRRRLRAGLVALFEGRGAEEIERIADGWFDEETQAALRAMVERIGKRA